MSGKYAQRTALKGGATHRPTTGTMNNQQLSTVRRNAEAVEPVERSRTRVVTDQDWELLSAIAPTIVHPASTSTTASRGKS
jgi:hypothetical protein